MTKLTTLAASLLIAGVLAAPAVASPAAAALPDNATAQKMVEDFSPWLSAVIQQKFAVANHIFILERYAQTELENSGANDVFAKFARVDGTPVSLIGVHILGEHMGTALFTMPTEHGPVAIKVSYYRYGTDTHIGKVEVATRWSDIETLSQTVDALPQPVTTTLESRGSNQ